MLHALSYSWSQKSPGDRSFGKKTERLLKCSKSIQFSSLSRALLYSAMLVLEHTHTHGIIFFLHSAESQTTSSSLTYVDTHLLLLPSSSCITHVPVLPGALSHARCSPLPSPHRVSSFLGTQGKRQPFVQLWFWMRRFLNSAFIMCFRQAGLLPHFLKLNSTWQQQDLSYAKSTKTL